MSKFERLRKFKRSFLAKHWYYGSQYKVEGVVQNKKQMLFVLSGYKPYLWDDVFERIKEFQTSDLEVCIVSSGKYCDELSVMCKRNNWVYISTKLNNVCVATNIAIREFPQAELIFKLDEDIYIPAGYFENMVKAFEQIESKVPAKIGYICPNLPLGSYSMRDFLMEQNCLEEFESKFGLCCIGGAEVNPCFRKAQGVDQFIWEKLGSFDERANEYSKKPFSYIPCVTRTGIAAILFTRKFWNDFGFLKRPTRRYGVGTTGDEGQITSFCFLTYRLLYRVNNILVGHFSFGGAEQQMLKYREEHRQDFELHK